MAVYGEVNLDKVLKSWSSDIFQSTSYSDREDHDKVEFIFDLAHIKLKDNPPTFNLESSCQQLSPKEKVIYTGSFDNDTDDVQKYPLKYSSDLVSIATVTMTRAMIYEKKTRLNLWELPKEVQTGGFGKELAVTGLELEEFRYQTQCRVEEMVEVRAKESKRFEVKVKEKMKEYCFEVKTKIKGKVHCRVIDSDDRELVCSLDGDIAQILETYGIGDDGLLLDGLTVHAGKAVFISKGRCRFKYCGEAEVKMSST